MDATATPKPKKKKAAAKSKSITERGKRKESVARASIKKGKGTVRVNRFNVNALPDKYLKAVITQPLAIAGAAVNDVDIDVTVYGGGPMGQAQAVANAITKAILAYTKDDSLRHRFLEIDKFLVVEDSRRVEPKKYKGPKARARFQKSYR
ncbi:30S ribosomal protein S9 [Candidatus Gugararchaeum adminiculabundum]|nr:30S ribosomal protein S9 [Candidatus Gugararchaeum adminiculabundum]